jgi:hypothetical protein
MAVRALFGCSLSHHQYIARRAVIANFGLRFMLRSPGPLPRHVEPAHLEFNPCRARLGRAGTRFCVPVLSICGQSARPRASALWAQRS